VPENALDLLASCGFLAEQVDRRGGPEAVATERRLRQARALETPLDDAKQVVARRPLLSCPLSGISRTFDTAGEFPPAADEPRSGQDMFPRQAESWTSGDSGELASSITFDVPELPSRPAHLVFHGISSNLDSSKGGRHRNCERSAPGDRPRNWRPATRRKADSSSSSPVVVWASPASITWKRDSSSDRTLNRARATRCRGPSCTR
jgi:hypothetical protein